MYEQLLADLRRFLADHYISISCTDIFEERAVLERAGVTSLPRFCQFGKVNDTTMYFAIRGIREDETPKILSLFKKLGDDTATYRFNDEMDAHYFEVDTKIAAEKLYPDFQARIIQLAQQKSVLLKDYRLQSVNSDEVKLMRLVDTVSRFEKHIHSLTQPSSQISSVNILSKLLSINFEKTLPTMFTTLRTAMLDHFFKKESHEDVITATRTLINACKQMSIMSEDEKFKY